MSGTQLISIISPVYGCRDCLQELSERVAAVFEDLPINWELILVDDCGPDKPWDLICELAEKDPRIKGVRLMGNHGQHLAIWAGFEHVSGDWAVVIDCDLQDDPTIIPKLHEQALAEEVDAVVVNRGEWKDSSLRRLSSQTFYKIIHLLAGVRLNNIGNFGIYSRRTVELLLKFKDKEVFLPFMIQLTGVRRGFMKLDRSGRHAGDSSYNLLRLLRLAVAITIRFTDRPLKLSVVVGLLFSSISAAFSVVVLFAWALGSFTVQGWTSLILSLWFLAGLILAVLGVHGFYMGRIFREVQERPRIIIDTTTDQPSKTR